MRTSNNMIVRRIGKREVQSMIRALRGAGLTVNKPYAGYYLCQIAAPANKEWLETNEPVMITLFSAMNGSRDYLVRMQSDLFTN